MLQPQQSFKAATEACVPNTFYSGNALQCEATKYKAVFSSIDLP